MSEESLLKKISLMKRRHSIQVLLPSVPMQHDGGKNRRQSLSQSIHTITKSMSRAMHIGTSGSNTFQQDGKHWLNKNLFRAILSNHYHQPDLKVTKLSIRCLSAEERLDQTPDTTLTDLLFREGDTSDSADCFWFRGIYEADVWVKCENSKKNLHLIIMWPPNQKNAELPHELSLSTETNSKDEDGEDFIKVLDYQETEQEIANRKQSLQDQIVVEEDESDIGIEIHERLMGIDLESSKNGILTANSQRIYEAEREYKAYTEVVRDLFHYLREDKGVRHPEEFLSLPTSYKCDSKLVSEMESESRIYDWKHPLGKGFSNGHSNHHNQTQNNQTNNQKNPKPPFLYEDLLIIQDLFASGYQLPNVERDENGLDYTHTILALEKLAAFHAVSYSMRKEKEMELLECYPMLQNDPVYRPATVDLFARTQSHIIMRLHNIFQQNLDEIKEFSAYFLDAVQNWHEVQQKLVKANDKFGVICHGDLWRQNVLYCYGSCLESQTDVIDVRFVGLHNMRFASCVTDLVYLIFTSVDTEVRRDHTINFLMVYHDHFSKAVRTLVGSSVKIFTREELFAEYQRLTLFGFLEALSLFSTAYEGQLHRAESLEGFLEGEREHPRYQDYRDTVLALIADVVRIKFQGQSNTSDRSN